MVRPKKTYKKSYKKRYYKRRYKKRYSKKYRFRKFRKSVSPEIRQIKGELNYVRNQDGTLTNNRGMIYRLIDIDTQTSATEAENVVYRVNGKAISGNKIKLKWLYIKGYYRCENTEREGYSPSAEVNVQLKIFRLFKNISNSQLTWGDIIQNNLDFTQLTTDAVQRELLYLADMKNDLKGKLWIKTKKIYRKYSPVNSFIPFKIRIPLYDAVVQCDSYKSGNSYIANHDPSTNGLYITMLSPQQVPDGPYTGDAARPYRHLYMKYKIYYTDN